MLELFLKLIEQLKGLAEREEADRRKLHDDFVKPIYDLTIELRDEAVKDRSEVMRTVKVSNDPLNALRRYLYSDISEQNITTMRNIGNKAVAKVQSLYGEEDSCEPFLNAVMSMFERIDTNNDPVVKAINHLGETRRDAVGPKALRAILDRANITRIYDLIMESEAKRYARIDTEYEKLRVTLLMPKKIKGKRKR